MVKPTKSARDQIIIAPTVHTQKHTNTITHRYFHMSTDTHAHTFTDIHIHTHSYSHEHKQSHKKYLYIQSHAAGVCSEFLRGGVLSLRYPQCPEVTQPDSDLVACSLRPPLCSSSSSPPAKACTGELAVILSQVSLVRRQLGLAFQNAVQEALRT